MQMKDARSISPEGQEALGKRAVRALLSRMKQTAAARTFGVARGTVARWMGQYHKSGEAALDRRPQGRPPAPKLRGEREAVMVALIKSHCSNELGLPGSLWTRERVGVLIIKRFGLALSVWTVRRYLRRWGPTPRSLPAGPMNKTLRRCGAGWKWSIPRSENRPKGKGGRCGDPPGR